jgi:hypothetical protein
MARKTVRVEVPNGQPGKLMDLGEKIVTRSTAPGAAGTLDPDRMTKLGSAIAVAKGLHSTYVSKDAEAQAARQGRNSALGIAVGQNAHTPDTALKDILYARDQLLIEYEGNEEKLAEYGFNVVIGTTKSPTRKNANGNN